MWSTLFTLQSCVPDVIAAVPKTLLSCDSASVAMNGTSIPKGTRFTEEETQSLIETAGRKNTCDSLPRSVVHVPEDTSSGSSCWERSFVQFSKVRFRTAIGRRVPIVKWLPSYKRRNLIPDVIGGFTVGITVIPQALAYATVIGLPPQYGLYSSFMGCFMYMLLGSTRAITIGPTAVLCLLSRESVARFGPAAAVMLSFLSGCIEFVLGLLGLGFLVEFIAAPVVTGFSAAAALTISTTQLKNLLGLEFEANGFLDTWAAVFANFHQVQLWDSIMGISCIALLITFRALEKYLARSNTSRLRGACWMFCVARNGVVILVCSLVAALVAVDSSSPLSLTGNITAGLPSFQLPPFSIEQGTTTYSFKEVCAELGSIIVVIPLIAVLETVAIAKSFGQQVDASQEMIALGFSNILGSFVSAFPVAASFSRTAVNAASGVRSPLNGLFTGLMVLLATSVLTPYFYFVPKSCLAAVIITALIFMVEVHVVFLVWRSRKVDVVPLMVTFVSCLCFDLEYGILIGTCLSIAMLLYATARPNIDVIHAEVCSVKYLQVTPDRSLLFTSMDYFTDVLRNVSERNSHPVPLPIVIDLTYVSAADFTTARGFKQLVKETQKRGGQVILRNGRPHVLSVLLGVHADHLVLYDGMDIRSLLTKTGGARYSEESSLLPSSSTSVY